MKCLLCGLLMICMLFCASAEESHSDGFLFMNAIDWNTTADEAAAILGEDVQRDVEHDPEIGSIEALLVQNVEVAGYPVPALQLVYFEGRLYSFECYFQQADVPDVQALATALSGFLGKAEAYGADAYTIFDYISGNKTLYTWYPDVLTKATLSQMNDGPEYGLYILNTSVGDAIEQAFEDAGYMDD